MGRYRPSSIVGHGGMSTVYRAVDEALGREVAIKVFRTGAAADLTRHSDEARVLASLNHHGLVTLLDAGIDDSDPAERHPFLVMEIVEGANLEATLAQRTLNAREISEIAYDLAEALEYVHAHGVVHRDIKPSNVMLVDYGTTAFRTRARLTDFGIALDAETARLTSDQATTGTAAYLSPEQARRQEVTTATDVYSLGLVLLQCFTGRLAFPGEAVESALKRLTEDPAIPADLPDAWGTILSSMLARDPAARPSIGELTIAFRQAVIAASARHKAEGETPAAAAVDDAADATPLPAERANDIPFDRITALAARTLSVPVAIVSLEGDGRIWFTTRRTRDTEADVRPLLDPAAAQAMGLMFQAQAPLVRGDGARIGTMTVLDVGPRELTRDEHETLEDLAAIVIEELDLREQADA